ncbi:DUF3265 domain-containing protein [Vibrio vulnificus]|nr:DUF3265 domain-containing protein [Vibrio vulnificus]
MTRRLRGIHAAWHFCYAVSFGGESGLRKVGLCGTHPLTQRYIQEKGKRQSHLPCVSSHGERKIITLAEV